LELPVLEVGRMDGDGREEPDAMMIRGQEVDSGGRRRDDPPEDRASTPGSSRESDMSDQQDVRSFCSTPSTSESTIYRSRPLLPCVSPRSIVPSDSITGVSSFSTSDTAGIETRRDHDSLVEFVTPVTRHRSTLAVKPSSKSVISSTKKATERDNETEDSYEAEETKESEDEEEEWTRWGKRRLFGLGSGKRPAKKVKLETGVKSRQAKQGEKLRKKNIQELKETVLEQAEEIKTLKFKTKEVEETMKFNELKTRRLEAVLRKLEQEKEQSRREQDEYFRILYFDLSPAERKRIKLSIFSNKGRLPEGTLSRLRENVGVNFSKSPNLANLQVPKIADDIRVFAELNSCDVPDAKANPADPDKPSVRYANHYRTVLYETFLADHPDQDCSYSTFCRYWPTYVVKPRLEDRGTCHCRECENAEMKMVGLKANKLISSQFDVFKALHNEREGDPDMIEHLKEEVENLKTGDRKKEIVTYRVWEDVEQHVEVEESVMRAQKGLRKKSNKAPEKRSKVATVTQLAERSLIQFSTLQAHLKRNHVIKQRIKERREDVMRDESGIKAMLHVDWSENGKVQVAREIQSAYFFRKSFSIHSGYYYLYNYSSGFAWLCEGSDHKVFVRIMYRIKLCFLIIHCLINYV
jgi:hypothetical protein